MIGLSKAQNISNMLQKVSKDAGRKEFQSPWAKSSVMYAAPSHILLLNRTTKNMSPCTIRAFTPNVFGKN